MVLGSNQECNLSSEEYFDSGTVARGLGDKWVLKSSNLRKLIRNVETYYHEVLHKSADFETVDISAVARSSDSEANVQMVELVVAAAVTCENVLNMLAGSWV